MTTEFDLGAEVQKATRDWKLQNALDHYQRDYLRARAWMAHWHSVRVKNCKRCQDKQEASK